MEVFITYSSLSPKCYIQIQVLTSSEIMILIYVYVVILNISEPSLLAEAFLLHVKLMTVIMNFHWLGFKDLCIVVSWELINVKTM